MNETLHNHQYSGTDFGTVVSEYPREFKKIVRELENLTKKVINAQYAVLFNETCIVNNLLPRYTNIRLPNRAVERQPRATLDYRHNILLEETENKKLLLSELKAKLVAANQTFESLPVSADLVTRTKVALKELEIYHTSVLRTKIQKKLTRLNGSKIPLPDHRDCFINLSSHKLSQDETDLLNLGINCHVLSKRRHHEKKTELELLYQQICELAASGHAQVNPDIREQLLSESTKSRGSCKSSLLTPRLRTAAEALKNNDDIIIRRADKAAVFVILDRPDYLAKTREILSDRSKFERIQRDPTTQLKVTLNKLISAANAAVGGLKFEPIVGEFSPGYFYGNIKTHKPGNPIRPIISQTPCPSYDLAKRLNALIAPFIPRTFSLKSTDEFLDILKVRERRGILASLDVQSLFTNVPVDETIDIILNYVFEHETLPPPSVPKEILRRMLSICTKESPFRCPEGKLYRQTDGVAMGSPLGVLFAEAYMAHVENEVFSGIATPHIYCRYVDDVFVDIEDFDQLETLKTQLEAKSVLKFTIDSSVNNKLPFLDVDVDASSGKFITRVYRKPTNTGQCLSGQSECPDRYKKSVISAYVRRALKTCSSWDLIHQELERVRQLFADNHYSAAVVEDEIRRVIDAKLKKDAESAEAADVAGAVAEEEGGSSGVKTHELWYQSQMSTAYKKDEKVLKDIVRRNCVPTKQNEKIALKIYYKSARVSNLLMKNNLSADSSPLSSTNVVYVFKCPLGDCAHRRNASYIGHTVTTLSRRITMHRQDGAPLRHLRQEHGEALTRQLMVSNTSILARCNNRTRLKVMEAVLIRDLDPIINRQHNMRGALTLYDSVPITARP